MKSRMTNVLSSLFLVAALGLAMVPWIGSGAEAVETTLKICDTYQKVEKSCCGDPTNCFCEIVVTP